MNYSQSEPGSFRDRTARVFYQNGRVLRKLATAGLDNWQALVASRLFRQFTSEGKLIGTQPVPAEEADIQEGWAAVLEHEKVPFVSYPYEWPFGMLKDAALLQLELLAAALEENLTLKDSSPFNIQWKGACPVFVDVTSFERLQPGEPWIGYRQFCQLFLYPLMLQAYKGIGYHAWLRGDLEGIEVQAGRRLFSGLNLLRRGVFKHVALHSKFQSANEGTIRNVRGDLQTAGFNKSLIAANARSLRRTVENLRWRPGESNWSSYSTDNSYEARDERRKQEFVREVVAGQPWDLVWDLGCNTGVFARIAAENSSYVVAFDSDHLSVERLYRNLKAERNNRILPLVCNLAAASPGLGWRGMERKSLEQRGRPRLVLCLALIHHMVIASNIPMREFVEWLAGIGGDLIIEFVRREDPMVQRLLRNKAETYADYGQGDLEDCLARYFTPVKSEILTSNTRVLYFLRRNSAAVPSR